MSKLNQAERDAIRAQVQKAVDEVELTDIHTHLYPADFGPLLLWGIDELLTYHYLVAETMRWGVITPEAYWKLSKTEQADLVWKTLFIDHSPYSEACRGVLTCLDKMGLDVSSRDLNAFRKFFASWKPEDYVEHVFKTARVKNAVMTNDPFDEIERPFWAEGKKGSNRLLPALRIDSILMTWKSAVPKLQEWGYNVEEGLHESTLKEVRRFLSDWVDKMQALYMAVSLPPYFTFPDDSACTRLIQECVLPVCEEKNIPFATMIGVKKLINLQLKLAGDGVGKSKIESVEYLCANYPNNKFMVTMLARENTHELCVTARKFPNLMLFGCWWFLNNPSLIEEMTRIRFELLGPSVIPQHSDCRVLDQMVYKWEHSRAIIGKVLADKYIDLAETGWKSTEAEIRREVDNLFGDNFWNFLKR